MVNSKGGSSRSCTGKARTEPQPTLPSRPNQLDACPFQYTSMTRNGAEAQASEGELWEKAELRAIFWMRKDLAWRHFREFVVGTLAAFAALWLVVESSSAFLSWLKPEGPRLYGALWIVSAVGGIWRAWPTKRIDLPIPASGSSFEVRFGDVFDGAGVIVIPVNEYFDGELGEYVSPNSVHGQFIQEVLGGQSKTFVDLTQQALANVVPEQADVERQGGQCDRYAIGTVARVDILTKRYLLVVSSHTDLESLKAHASVDDLWKCLAGVWDGIRQYSGGRPVRLPLIGSGLSGVGLPPGMLLGIIATSLLDHTKRQTVADNLTLVLPPHLMAKLDLNSLKGSYL